MEKKSWLCKSRTGLSARFITQRGVLCGGRGSVLEGRETLVLRCGKRLRVPSSCCSDPQDGHQSLSEPLGGSLGSPGRKGPGD